MWRGIRLTFYAVSGILLGGLGFEAANLPRVSALIDQNPATTSMIEARNREFRAKGLEPKRVQIWVPLEKISPQLQRAVLAGEDTNFATHHGFDYQAIQRAYEKAQKDAEKEAKQEGDDDSWFTMPEFKGGASTISQQLAKNLYLSSERTFMRKGQEAIITYFLERNLSKRRILEIYLNVIEWGDGIYGAEAASRYYCRGSAAANLNARDAAYLAAMIPNPRTVFSPFVNPKRVLRRQRIIMRGMPSVKMPAGTG